MALPLSLSPADGAALDRVHAGLDRWLVTTPEADRPAVALARLRGALEALRRASLANSGAGAALVTGGPLAAVDHARDAMVAATAATGANATISFASLPPTPWPNIPDRRRRRPGQNRPAHGLDPSRCGTGHRPSADPATGWSSDETRW